MKAVLYSPPDGAILKDVPIPEIGPGEALIATEASGLCGSDILKLAHGHSATLGHEIAGHVAAVGTGVKSLAVGDRVVAAHHVPCGDCHYCRRGSHSMCRQFKATNIEPGGFSEFVRVSAEHVKHTVLKIPDGLSSQAASLTEPLACCLRNVKRMGLRAGDAAAVVGLGSIGLLTGQLLRHFKVTTFGLDPDPKRSDLARRMGIETLEKDRFLARMLERTAGRGLDALVFTAGSATLVSERLSWLRDGGILGVFASFHPEGKAALDMNTIYERELTVLSTYSSSPDDLREALELLASGAVDPTPFMGRTFVLSEFSDAVRKVQAREVLKAIFVVGGQ